MELVKHAGDGWVMLDVHGGWADSQDVVKLLPVLSAIDMPWVRAREGREEWFGWNGAALSLNEEAENIFHEVGHWLCSAPERRHLPDFGIVESEFYVPHGPALWPDEEEAMASLLGILLERALARPWADTFCYHSWRGRDGGGGVTETLRMLREAGLLRGLMPTCLSPLPVLVD